jgi:two-component system LytT family response regulator
MTPLRVMVVEDEPLAREGLVELLRALPDVEVAGAFQDGVSALRVIGERAPDVLCLDIRMPGLDGFDVVAALEAERLPAIIFITAYDAFAVRAFEVEAVDYLLKPVTADRLATAIERTRRARVTHDAGAAARLGALLERMAPARPSGAGRLIVREVGQVLVIPTRDVDWIEGADYYAKLHVGPKAHLIRESLASLEQRLDAARFLRVHRSAILNLTRVRVVEAADRGDAVAVLVTGARVKVTSARRESLEERLAALHDAR